MRHDTEDAYHTGTATAEGRIAPLRSLHGQRAVAGPDIRGGYVMGSDGRRIGTVHDLLVDTESRQIRYLDVALDRDLLPGAPGGREHYGPEGQPMPGAEAMGFTAATEEGPGVVSTSAAVRAEAEPVTGHLDESVSRPSHDHVNRTVGAEVLEEARSHPLFAPDERPITGHLDEGGLGEGRHVLIPVGAAHLDETDNRIHVDLRSAEAAALPAYRHESFDRDSEHELRRRYDRDYVVVVVEAVEFYSHPLYDEGRFWGGRRR